MSDNARIDIRGKSVDLPIVEGSEGELGLDISKLRAQSKTCLLYTSPSPRDQRGSRMPSSA